MADDRKNLVERYTGRPASGPNTESPAESETEYQAAPPVSGQRPPELMLELRFKTGDSLALSYALLISVQWNRSDGITLEFTTHRVNVRGRNLRELFRALVAHRLSYVQEFPNRIDDQPEESTVITSLEVAAAS